MSRVRVESAVKIKDMSRVRVESRWYRHLSQSWVNWILLESKLRQWVFEEKTSRSCSYLKLYRERTNLQLHSTALPPPPGQQLFPKLGKMWWVVSQIWLNSDSNELSQSWVRLVNLDFELSRGWVRLANLGFELSRSWVTWIAIWIRVESARKNGSSTTLELTTQWRQDCLRYGLLIRIWGPYGVLVCTTDALSATRL